MLTAMQHQDTIAHTNSKNKYDNRTASSMLSIEYSNTEYIDMYKRD